MKTSHLICGAIFTATITVVALPAAEEHTSQHVLGCSGGEGIQRLKFTGGDKLYDMFVPATSTSYTIAGSTPDTKCVDNSALGGPCVSCDVHVDYVQLMSDGQCEITITKDDGSRIEHYDLYGTQRLGFGTPGRPVKISCAPYEEKRSYNHVDEAADKATECMIPDDSNVTFTSGSSTYLLPVPPNKSSLNLGDGGASPCTGPLEIEPSRCSLCDFVADRIQVTESAGICAFHLSSYNHALRVDHKSSRLALTAPGRVLSVQCGLSKDDFVPPALSFADLLDSDDSARDPKPPTGVETIDSASHGRAKVTARMLPTGILESRVVDSADTTWYNTAIATHDGSMYFLAAPNDSRTRFLADLTCIPLSSGDVGPVPCNTIGLATSVNTKIKTGPCGFVTEGGNTYVAPYLEQSTNDKSQMTPKIPFRNPSQIVSVRCG
ncbi:hypothetical protein LTR05_006035 [Lithohypha guttulata]|uniref:Uncharacterized protein n=1 Tax=Lithohypha guttulata TaxID=1690604 RepID=A0AAN7SXM0_9EURO|nr:hypothetical protein LTR05_006035 [Lithohypha guttulata]